MRVFFFLRLWLLGKQLSFALLVRPLNERLVPSC